MNERRGDIARTVALVVVAALCVGLVRGRLFDANHHVRETSDVYTLPPPQELVVLSLGWRSALADLLWANVLVQQGLHTEQRRRFGNLIPLIEAINELEPTYREPYMLTDALVTFQSNTTPREEVLKVREIMSRGVRERPLDGELYLAAGEFMAFIAPGTYLTDPAEQEEWRITGARLLARAAELGGANDALIWQALGGANILGKAGQRDASIRFLRRSLAVTDDAELKEKITIKLNQLLGQQRDDVFHRLDEGVARIRHGELPQVSRMEYVVLGPPRDPAYCAGSAHTREAACASTWREWEERSEEERRRP